MNESTMITTRTAVKEIIPYGSYSGAIHSSTGTNRTTIKTTRATQQTANELHTVVLSEQKANSKEIQKRMIVYSVQ